MFKNVLHDYEGMSVEARGMISRFINDFFFLGEKAQYMWQMT